MSVPEVEEPVEQLVARARVLATTGKRRLLGITGSPGAGKSTLAEALVQALGPTMAVLVPMDGFHLANEVLDTMDARGRKGAPDTFDADGYVALIRRLREQPRSAAAGRDRIVYVPRFRRELDEPIGSAIPVLASVPLVITEGNYLLLDEPPWCDLRPLLDEMWFLSLPDATRLSRLTKRHEHYGETQEQAQHHALGSDQRNAELIERTKSRADLVVHLVTKG